MFRILGCCCCLLLPATMLDAEVSQADRARLNEARSQLREAGKAYRGEDWDQAAQLLDAAKEALEGISAEAEAQAASQRLWKSWRRASSLVDAKREKTSPPIAPKVSFVEEIAPVLVERCTSCHGAERAREGLRLHTLAGLQQGGDSGPIIVAGSPQDSLLLRKVKGMADGERMPPDGPPLSEAQIEQLARWVAAGAPFDAAKATVELRTLIRQRHREKLSPEELRGEALEAARERWRRAFPGKQADEHVGAQFIGLAAPGDADWSSVEARVADHVKQVGRLLLPKSREGLFSAPWALYILPKGYGFAEFQLMVERRQSEQGTASYWQQRDGWSYLVLGPQTMGAEDLEDLDRLLPSLAALQWGAPDWYAEGLGWVTFARLHRKDAAVRSWPSRARQVFPTIKSSKTLLEGSLPDNSQGIANWAFVHFLHRDARRAERLHLRIRAGESFETAFASAYGADVTAVCDAWLGKSPGKRSR